MTVLEPLLLLHPSDNVAVARRALKAGEILTVAGKTVQIAEAIPANHKVAVNNLREGAVIRKFGQPIGSASTGISSGQWVHVHNVSIARDKTGYEFSTDIVAFPKPGDSRTFMGFRRKDGRAGTRNYIALISTVNCSATTSRYVAQELAKSDLSRYGNIDGVIPVVHKSGCAFAYNGEDHLLLNRTLAGFARHPNIAACLKPW